MNNTIVIIPHYNHSTTIKSVVKQILDLRLPILIIDDGSNTEHQLRLKQLEQFPNINISYLPYNQGKGAAMKIGFQQAYQQGYQSAIQVDADGQHQLTDISKMLELANNYPNSVICGKPIYSEDAPKSRLYGRKITDFWNIIHTLSFDIKDGMCGFRLYPLKTIIKMLEQEKIGNRMDFDIEILIKSHWHQIPIHWFNTPVRYDKNGVSHFRAWQDNWQISKMHTKLFWGMVLRVLTGKKV